MVDSLNTPQTDDSGAVVSAEPSGSKGLGSFMASTMGKLVVGGIALLLIVGAVAVILFLFVFNDTPPETAPIVVPAASNGATSTASIDSSPEVRPADDFADTFAFRNIFQPTVKVTLTPEADTTGDGTGTDTTEVDVPADTLYLSSTATVDGVPVANLIWNGVTYTLEEGESIPDTPWQVLSISGDTVVMLYGDSRVSLTVGQGLSK